MATSDTLSFLSPAHLLRRLGNRAMRCYPLLLCVLAVISFFSFYPGLMAYDSYVQWQDVVDNVDRAWHPPIMAWWWRILTVTLWDRPAVLLLFQLLVYWSAVNVFARSFGSVSPVWRLLWAALWFVPPVALMTAMLVKDSQMAVCWLLAFALMTECYRQEKRPTRACAAWIVLLLFYGTAVRYNSFVPLPPLCWWFAVCWRFGSRARTLAAAAMLYVCLLLANVWVNVALTDKYSDPNLTSMLMINDIGRVSTQLQVNLFPDHLRNQFTLDFPAETCCTRVVHDSDDPEKFQALIDAYASMIVHYPQAYLERRWEIFSLMNCIGLMKGCGYVDVESMPDRTIANRKIANYLDSSPDVFFRGYAWLLLAIVVQVVSLRAVYLGRRAMLPVAVLASSALLNEFSFLVFGWSGQFRYIYWTVLATAAAVPMMGGVLHAWHRETQLTD